MSTPHTPLILSNDPDDFVQSGLYPGGTGIVEDIFYALWDYNGKQPPDSVCAVKLIFKPTDGSNEGKDVEIFWSVGPSSEFAPSQDGGFVFGVGNATGMRNSSNWYHIGVALRDNCGMEKGKLNGPAGIKALLGSTLTLVRKDQPTRDGMDAPPQAQGQGHGGRQNKATFLVPTAAVFTWDKPGTGRAKAKPAAKPGPVTVPAAPATPAPRPVMAAPAPAAPVNGSASATVDVDTTIAEVLAEILTETEGNAVEFTNLPNLVLNKVGPQGRGVVVKQRMEITKQVKDPSYITALAGAQGWTFDGTFLASA
jgi:hypothetical protein